MKKLFFCLFMVNAFVCFNSCGSDDDPIPEPDYTLNDKSEIMGDQDGKVEIKLSLGNFNPYNISTANTKFVTSDNKDVLHLFILAPAEIGGPIKTSDYKRIPDDKQYTFNIDTYSPSEKTGNEIPEYIVNWYKDYTISKVIMKGLKCSGAKYDKDSKEISFSLSGALELYTRSGDNEERFATNTITYTFSELKK